jgi:hypothetical protein
LYLKLSIGCVCRGDVTLNLATEKDPEILRKAALLLERENERLVARIVELTRRLQKLEGKEEAGQLSLEIAKLEQQLSKARQMLFGASSEKRPTADSEQKKAAESRGQEAAHGAWSAKATGVARRAPRPRLGRSRQDVFAVRRPTGTLGGAVRGVRRSRRHREPVRHQEAQEQEVSL